MNIGDGHAMRTPAARLRKIGSALTALLLLVAGTVSAASPAAADEATFTTTWSTTNTPTGASNADQIALPW